MTKNTDHFDPMNSTNAPVGQRTSDLAAFSKRRRLIRLGATAVPVVLTLSSRPVMAWHCNSTSAWGSAQLAGNVGSAKTRLDDNQVSGNECWTVANWKTDTYQGSNMNSRPWSAVKAALRVADRAAAKQALMFNQIFPLGVNFNVGNGKVWDFLQSASGWTLSVTVARLNSIYASSYKDQIDRCIVSKDTGPNGGDQIQRMAKLGPLGYFSPNAPTYKWTSDDIVGYLSANWLAR